MEIFFSFCLSPVFDFDIFPWNGDIKIHSEFLSFSYASFQNGLLNYYQNFSVLRNNYSLLFFLRCAFVYFIFKKLKINYGFFLQSRVNFLIYNNLPTILCFQELYIILHFYYLFIHTDCFQFKIFNQQLVLWIYFFSILTFPRPLLSACHVQTSHYLNILKELKSLMCIE